MKLILPMLILLTACGKTETKETTSSYVMPPELKRCHVYELSSKTEKDLFTVVCPDVVSTAWEESRSCGKGCHTTDTYSVTTNRN